MLMVFAFHSCSEEDQSEFSDLTAVNDWQFNTQLSFTPEVGKEAFIWEKNILTLAEYWVNDEVVFNGNISSSLNTSQFSKIDFYITAEEKGGYNYTAPFDKTGRLITSVSNISDEGNFTLTLNAEDTYQLFGSNFVNNRSQTKVFEGDLFEIHWVITNVDGSILDSRDYVDGEYRYSITGKYQELAPPVWQDTYDFEWLSGDDLLAGFGLISATSGTLVITESATPGTYDIPNMLFNADFGIPFPGTLVFDFDSGLTTTADAYGFGVSWEYSNINESSIDIEIKGVGNLLPAGDTIFKVRLTRQDGANWPSNIHH